MIKDEVKEDIRYEIKENKKEEIKEDKKEDRKEEIKEDTKEDKDTKWEPIDWTKDMKEKDKDTKWEPIDWTKDTKKEEKDTQWEPIDWTKDTTETKKKRGYKNANLDDIIMTGEDFKEDTKYKNGEEDFIERIDERLKEHNYVKDFIDNGEEINDYKFRLEKKQVRALQNKTNILRNIYNGKYAEKCPGCKTTIAKLPAFDFHHPIKELKTKSKGFHGNWMKKLKLLEKEKVIPICHNCHLKTQSKYYDKYKNLIENKNYSKTSLEGIEDKLYKEIHKKYPRIGNNEAYQIKSWMSKRIVVDRLYNGGCIGCKEKNLGMLQFHHRDLENKTFKKYDKLRYTNLEKIEKKLIQDDAVCLCGNCHRMINSRYYIKNHQEIVGIKYSQEIRKFNQDLKEKIENFQFPANILKEYPFIETEKIEIGRKPKSNKLNPDEEKIKEEIKSINWDSSQKWKLPSGKLLDPTKECSQTNPLYKHKNWLTKIYSDKKWGLTDEKIARITNTSQTTINYWRKKLNIETRKSNVKQKLFFDGKNKECGNCHQVKTVNQFTWREKNGKIYPISKCKSCSNEYKRQSYKKSNLKKK